MKRTHTLGLCMIVKDEAHVILRCLASVRPLVDYILIEDTGSTDGTQQVIRNYLHDKGIPGEVFEEPWQDFAHNRCVALARLREHADIDYALIMDADDTLHSAPGFDPARFKAELSADVYHVQIRLGSVTYHRPQICSNHLHFRYRGVLHEFLEIPAHHSQGEARGLAIIIHQDGARSQSKDKYRRDASLLEHALTAEHDPFLQSRYTFYLAQSYRDAGDLEKALTFYLQRAQQGFWDQEIFVSLYEAAGLKEQLGHPASEIIGLHLEAYDACPTRAESLHGAMRYCRTHGKYHQGYLIGKHAVTLSRPAAGLFLQEWIYEYGLFDEFSVLAYWSAHFEDCRAYAERLLLHTNLPAHERERVTANMQFALARLAGNKPAGKQANHS